MVILVSTMVRRLMEEWGFFLFLPGIEAGYDARGAGNALRDQD